MTTRSGAQAARRVKRGGALQATPVGAGGGGGRALLALTIALEVFATTSMKLASTRPVWHLGTVVGYGSCFSVFPLVLRKMPLGVAYAIWSGVGTALTALIGAAMFGGGAVDAEGGGPRGHRRGRRVVGACPPDGRSRRWRGGCHRRADMVRHLCEARYTGTSATHVGDSTSEGGAFAGV